MRYVVRVTLGSPVRRYRAIDDAGNGPASWHRTPDAARAAFERWQRRKPPTTEVRPNE